MRSCFPIISQILGPPGLSYQLLEKPGGYPVSTEWYRECFTRTVDNVGFSLLAWCHGMQ